GVESKELDGWISRPETQAVVLLRLFEMRHADFEDRVGAVPLAHRRDERAADVGAVECRAEFEGPPSLERGDGDWEAREPSHALGRLAAIGNDGGRDADRHLEYCSGERGYGFAGSTRAG